MTGETEQFEILPQHKKTLKGRLLIQLHGASLEKIRSHYEAFLNSNFNIRLLLEKRKTPIEFQKSSKLNVRLKLDDEIVSPLDSLKMKMNASPPTLPE